MICGAFEVYMPQIECTVCCTLLYGVLNGTSKSELFALASVQKHVNECSKLSISGEKKFRKK